MNYQKNEALENICFFVTINKIIVNSITMLRTQLNIKMTYHVQIVVIMLGI